MPYTTGMRQADDVQQAPDGWQPRPGEMHPIDKAFHDLTLKERDYERMKVDRLREAIAGIVAAAAQYGVGDQVGEAIAHAQVVARSPCHEWPGR
jgi:hypothetical protein